MALDHWFAFAAASAVLLAIPGPTILLVISYGLGHGRKAVLPTVAGVTLGDFTAMTASMLGLGALLATSAMLFTALKWFGAAYLIYLGIKLWRSPAITEETADAVEARDRPMRMFLHTYVVTALNPKSIVFFVAFLPQFLDTSAPLAGQMALFEATFLTFSATIATVYGLTAAMAQTRAANPDVRRWVNRTGGSLMVAAGLLALGLRKLT
jgi:threonine/homoserine/homoserine lactone efflux protein